MGFLLILGGNSFVSTSTTSPRFLVNSPSSAVPGPYATVHPRVLSGDFDRERRWAASFSLVLAFPKKLRGFGASCAVLEPGGFAVLARYRNFFFHCPLPTSPDKLIADLPTVHARSVDRAQRGACRLSHPQELLEKQQRLIPRDNYLQNATAFLSNKNWTRALGKACINTRVLFCAPHRLW